MDKKLKEQDNKEKEKETDQKPGGYGIGQDNFGDFGDNNLAEEKNDSEDQTEDPRH